MRLTINALYTTMFPCNPCVLIQTDSAGCVELIRVGDFSF